MRLENGGSAPLTLSRLRLDGAGASDFRTLRDGCGSRTLAPGEHCTVTYSFRPTREGERRATLRVSSDAETDGGASRLVGKGLPQEPILGLDPERLDFAPLLIGERAPKQRISLTNDGTGPLEVRRLRLSEGGAGFEILPSTCGVLRPGQSCAVEVAFAPTREGVADAFLEIVHDVGAGLHRVALVGEGTAPQAFVEPSQVVFGEVPLGDSTPSRTVRLVNSGSGPLRIDGVRLRGASTEAFDARAENCRELEPGDVCRVEVRFAPRRAGASRAELEIRHSAANGLSTISLTGVATTAEAAVEPSRIDLGEVRVGEERRGSARVLNRGRAPLTVERVELGGAASEIEVIDDRCARRQVAPGEHCTVSVRFAPTTEGRRRADLRIVHNAGAPLVVGLEAVATAAPRGALRVDVGGVDFAPVVVGAVGSAPSPVTLRNAGDGPVRLEALRLVGAHPEDFRIDGAGCGTGHVLAPGETCRVLLRFAPRAAGERSALLLIDHDGEGGALPVDLRGVGEAGAPSANQP